jgi:hypothetical protein
MARGRRSDQGTLDLLALLDAPVVPPSPAAAVPDPVMPHGTRQYGAAEAERQIRVAQRLHCESGDKRDWYLLSCSERRPFIDASCRGDNRDFQE